MAKTGESLHELSDSELLRRFVRGRDATAFEQIVRRHGPMVLGVCKRMLRKVPDAEDAFQATFLALSVKAASIRRTTALAAWLHRVAVRASLEVQSGNERWTRNTQHAAEIMTKRHRSGEIPIDLKEILDHELNKVPARYRAVVLMCDLEGCSQRQAAQQLSVPVGTISSRLTRGRSLLRKRLVRRGVQLSVLGVAMGRLRLADAAPQIRPDLIDQTVKSATYFAAGESASSSAASHQLTSIAQSVLRSMAIAQVQAVAATLLVSVGLVAVVRAPFAMNAPLAMPDGTKAVAPGGFRLEDVEGTSLGTIPTGTPYRIQSLWLTQDFAQLPAPHGQLVAISFRPDMSAGAERIELDIQLRLSTTRASGLAPRFDSNLGADTQRVFSDSLGFRPSAKSGAGPRAFDYRIPLESPFEFDPRSQNLVVDSVVTVRQGPVNVDAQPLGRGRAILAQSASARSPTGTMRNRIRIVIEFIFAPRQTKSSDD